MTKEQEAHNEAYLQEVSDSIGWTAFADRFLPSAILGLVVILVGLSVLYIVKF